MQKVFHEIDYFSCILQNYGTGFSNCETGNHSKQYSKHVTPVYRNNEKDRRSLASHAAKSIFAIRISSVSDVRHREEI